MDVTFYLAAIAAVSSLGMAKGGFTGLGVVSLPLMAMVVPPLQAAAILMPILIVQGAADQYGTVRQVEVAQQECYCPVEVALLPGVRHAPHREAPGVSPAHRLAMVRLAIEGNPRLRG